MVQAFRDQIRDTNSRKEYITLLLKVFLDIVKNAIQESVGQFSITNHPALADVLWILGFTLLYGFTTRWWISYGQSIFRPLENTPFGQSSWSGLVSSAMRGLMIGLSQWAFIRKHIHFNRAWPFATGIFYSIGGFLSSGIDYYIFTHLHKFEALCKLSVYQSNFHANVQPYIRLSITAYFVSLSQVVFLPKSRFRWLWIPVSLIAWLCDRQVTLYLYRSVYRVGPFSNWEVFGVIAEGLILGVFLRLLFIYVELDNRAGEVTGGPRSA
ncbi:MAG: hypothetical protein P9X24_00370 [Candidatus Hatepunaea meridiana]|nr:hypothetical protein [Candidatus Hatepunaea meridiana]